MAVKLVSRLKETRQILVSILQQEETCVSVHINDSMHTIYGLWKRFE